MTGDDTIAENRVGIVITPSSGHERIDLDERIGVEEELDPLAGRQLSARVLLLDLGVAATEPGSSSHVSKARSPILIRRHGSSIRCRSVFAQGQGGHDSPATYPQKR